MEAFAAQRKRMVAEVEAMYAETAAETGLERMSPEVRAALGKVERHRFVPPDAIAQAYRNHPLPIGSGQTISQPYIVALMSELLEGRLSPAAYADLRTERARVARRAVWLPLDGEERWRTVLIAVLQAMAEGLGQ